MCEAKHKGGTEKSQKEYCRAGRERRRKAEKFLREDSEAGTQAENGRQQDV